MHPIVPILCVFALFAVFAWSARRGNRSSNDFRAFTNIGEKVHRESITKKADAAIGRWLLVKFGTDVDHFNLAGAADQAIGTTIDETAAAEDLCTLKLLGTSPETHRMIANAAITVGSPVFAAASGKVAPDGQKLLGIALTAAAADGDIIEVNAVVPHSAPARLVYAAIRTWAAGAAVSEGFTLTGVLSTDMVLATPIAVAGAGLLQKVVPTANTLTATTNANWANGDKYSYQVWR